MPVASRVVDGLDVLTLSSPALSATVIPQMGGKIISLGRRLADGSEQELLWRNPHRRLVVPPYDAEFADYDASAFDECFPGIGAGPYPSPAWPGVANPDHGEVWALPWRAAVEGEALHLSVHGVRFPYLLEREMVYLAPDRLALLYTATNHSALPLPYIWSAHPLFAVTTTTRILLPPEVVALTIDSSIGERLGRPDETVAWPRATTRGGTVDLSCLTADAGHGDKVYVTAPLVAGWCALYDEAAGSYIGFAFDHRQVPYLGVWINQGGWPAEGPACFNVALEPCTGWPDSLARAAEQGTLSTLPPFGSHTWTIVLAAGQAASPAEVAARLGDAAQDLRAR